MAFFPCDAGPHPNRGRNANYYVGLAQGGEFERWQLRLCERHSLDVQKHLAQFEVVYTDDATGFFGAVHACLACLEPTGEVDWQLFVTGYPAHNERKDYWAQLHTNCRVPPYLPRTNRNTSRTVLDSR